MLPVATLLYMFSCGSKGTFLEQQWIKGKVGALWAKMNKNGKDVSS